MTREPAPYEVMPIIRARALDRAERLPGCGVNGCLIKRALFILEDYQDAPYLTRLLAQARDPQDVGPEMGRHVLAEYTRYEGRPHCYQTVNICHGCLCSRVESYTRSVHGADLVNQLRDAKGKQSLLVYVLYRESGAPGRFAFCSTPDIEGCIREAKK